MTRGRTGAAVLAAYATLVLLHARHGVNVTGDGRGYLLRAQAVADGDLAFAIMSGAPETYVQRHFPPLYPALLAGIDAATPLTLTEAAVAINIAAGAALLLAVESLRRTLAPGSADRTWPVVIALLTLLTAPMVRLGASALSDLAFFALWAWMSVVLLAYVRRPRPATGTALVGLCAALVLLRYVGAALVAGAVAVLVVDALRRRRLPLAGAALAAGAILPTVAWYLWAGRYDAGGNGHGRFGTLSVAQSLLDSVIAFGSLVLGIKQERVDGVTGRGYFLLPDAAEQAVGVAAVATTVAMGALVVIRLMNRRAATIPPVSQEQAAVIRRLLVPSLLYVGALLVYRAWAGFFVIQRYHGILPIVGWLLVMTVALASHRRQASWLTVVAGAVVVVNLAGIGVLLA